MQWIISNISWIKDVLWVIFTLIAIIIAILTYRRARYTLLQPLRSEVVKRQTELLAELPEYIAGSKKIINFGIDYMGIIACNAYKLLENRMSKGIAKRPSTKVDGLFDESRALYGYQKKYAIIKRCTNQR